MKLEGLKDNDYIYCKRTMIVETNYGKYMAYRQDRKYLVEIDLEDIVVIMGENDIIGKVCEMSFCMGVKKDQKKFDKYFYSLKELRKKKLEELNENR